MGRREARCRDVVKKLMMIIKIALVIIEDSHGSVVVDSSFLEYDVVHVRKLLLTDTGSEPKRTGSSCYVVFASQILWFCCHKIV